MKNLVAFAALAVALVLGGCSFGTSDNPAPSSTTVSSSVSAFPDGGVSIMNVDVTCNDRDELLIGLEVQTKGQTTVDISLNTPNEQLYEDEPVTDGLNTFDELLTASGPMNSTEVGHDVDLVVTVTGGEVMGQQSSEQYSTIVPATQCLMDK